MNRIERGNFIHGVGLAAGAAAAPLVAPDAVSFLSVGRMKCKRNRYRDWHRDQTFIAQSLATDSSIPVAISGTILNLKKGVAIENNLIVPAAMITILCQPQ